jgi:hypothetical protein
VRRFDPVQAAAVGIAAVAALLVAGGLGLSLFGALDQSGWIAVAVAGAVAVLVAARDPGRRAVPALLATVAFGLVVAAVALARDSALDHERGTTFTQLWLVQRSAAGRTEVGVRNEEQRAIVYRLRIAGPRGAPPLVDRTLQLGSSQAWSQELVIPAGERPEQVTAELYRPGDATPYRRAHVWTSQRP